MKKTPSINMRGLYEVKAPYTLRVNEVYVCHAVRSFKAIQEAGTDTFKKYYEPNGLTVSDFQNDFAINANIVTLISENTNHILYVPDTYILAYPDMSNVTYQRVVISLDMGMLPDYLDVEFLQSEIQSMCLGMLGVNSTPRTHIAPTTGAITPNDHQTLEAARRARITNTETAYATILRQQQENQSLREMIEDMTQILIDNDLIVDGTP